MKQLIRHILREHTREIEESGDYNRSNTEDFIVKAQAVHGDKYNYDKVNYKNSQTNVIINCPTHGDFEQTPGTHLKSSGCPKCGRMKAGESNRKIQRKDKNIFIDQANIVHNKKYGYSKINYQGSFEKIVITCPIHGDFEMSPSKHLGGKGCPKCGAERAIKAKDLNTFIRDAKIVHGDKYNYDKVNYKNSQDKVTITCPTHGDFEQRPTNHINSRRGCPICAESKGENLINQILKRERIKFEREKRFLDCTNISETGRCSTLPFDFYIPELNTCIEYDGQQHFEPVIRFGGDETFEKQKKRDKIKNRYCKKNGIKLIRIPYTMKKEEIEPYILKELGIK